MKNILFHTIIIIMTFLNSPSFAVGENFYELFQKANQHYIRGEYTQAAVLYEKILISGYLSKELLYNLGNVYFRLGEYHKSILFYERARILDPFDEDIKFNLQIANLHNVDKIQEAPKFFLKQISEDIRDSLSSAQWATFAIVSIWIASVLLILFLLNFAVLIRKITFFAGLVFAILFIFATTFGLSRYNYEQNHNLAIIFAENAYIKSSPE
ncbi:MAG: tetratricopeptide repeat protein, partial [Candidatus Kapaibacteriota bacterium]